MIYFQLFFFSCILILVEFLLLPIPFFFLAILSWSLFVVEEQAFILAFGGGILYDILLLHPIGYSSALFLLLVFVATSYKRTMQSSNMYFLAFWSFVSTIAIVYFNTRVISVGIGVISAILTFLLARLLYFRLSRVVDMTSWIK